MKATRAMIALGAGLGLITSEEILSSRDRRRWRIEQHTDEQAREADEA
jgi:hypothetical protein